jgi:hypothetical protein
VNASDASRSFRSPASQIDLSGVDVRREGRVEPLLHAHLELSSSAAHWSESCTRTTRCRRVDSRGTSPSTTSCTSSSRARSGITIGCAAAMAPRRCRVPRRPVNPQQLIAGGARCFEAGRPVRGHAASRRAFLQRAADLIKKSERDRPRLAAPDRGGPPRTNDR